MDTYSNIDPNAKSLKYSALERGQKYEMWREEKLGEAAILRGRLRRRGVWLENVLVGKRCR